MSYNLNMDQGLEFVLLLCLIFSVLQGKQPLQNGQVIAKITTNNNQLA